MNWFRKKTPATRKDLQNQFRRKLSAADAERVAAWALPAIGFHDGQLGNEPSEIGATRFGGRPDLPDFRRWPDGPDGPLAFLGQLRLEEIASLDIDRMLPAAGLLTFFYNIYDYPWGYEVRDREKFAVLFSPPGIELRRRDFPDAIRKQNRVVHSRSVAPYLRWELPTSDNLAHETLRVGRPATLLEPCTDRFTERYWQLDSDLCKPHIPVGNHQLLGWANGLYQQEHDYRLICEEVRRGFPASGTPERAAALIDRQRWRCLLQVGNDFKLYHDSWADGGTIAFMIRNDDLKELQFDRCWCLLSSS